jgi:hypothetical protein
MTTATTSALHAADLEKACGMAHVATSAKAQGVSQ